MLETYTVNWSITVDAESHEEAAKKALEVQRKKGGRATVFEVSQISNSPNGPGNVNLIDLLKGRNQHYNRSIKVKR